MKTLGTNNLSHLDLSLSLQSDDYIANFENLVCTVHPLEIVHLHVCDFMS